MLRRMKLIAFSLEGYRRFVQKTSVKLHGDMIAFVGPNEAGKSSLLRALTHLNHYEGFERTERPRRTGLEPRLLWQFELEAGDLETIADIPEAAGLTRVSIEKSSDGTHTWSFHPKRPQRDVQVRSTLARDLGEVLAQLSEAELDQLSTHANALNSLESDVEDLTAEAVQALSLLTAELEVMATDTEDSKITTSLIDLRERLRDLAVSELNEAPSKRVIDALDDRKPKFILFDALDRDLQSEYDLQEQVEDTARPLMHLVNLAGLSLSQLLVEVNESAWADAKSRIDAANRKLMSEFDQAWNQEQIALQLDLHGTTLRVHAFTPHDQGLSEISERSEGLLWFAALLAFAHGWKEHPILLLDEIETHLHYDAQADLIEVLSRQTFTSKVIYTTHSFGALPHDLGAGVRVVKQVDRLSSELSSQFWRDGAGFTPLLAAMGAATTSLTPARHAVIAEGPTEAILAPTLLRDASKEARLGFQVAPGLASVASAEARGLDAEAGHVCFLVDGDEGGNRIRKKLLRAGLPEERIIALVDQDSGEALEFEDLIDRDVYAKAAREELATWNGSVEFTGDDLPGSMRSKALVAWASDNGMSAPDKTAVAERILSYASDEDVFDQSRVTTLVWLLGEIRARLELPIGAHGSA